ncbi:MAG: hypothetical protein IID55_14385, partial [Proteobacteria bacterium]|nr:hypothetical protein [Pseudomonadota bacterium]
LRDELVARRREEAIAAGRRRHEELSLARRTLLGSEEVIYDDVNDLFAGISSFPSTTLEAQTIDEEGDIVIQASDAELSVVVYLRTNLEELEKIEPADERQAALLTAADNLLRARDFEE